MRVERLCRKLVLAQVERLTGDYLDRRSECNFDDPLLDEDDEILAAAHAAVAKAGGGVLVFFLGTAGASHRRRAPRRDAASCSLETNRPR